MAAKVNENDIIEQLSQFNIGTKEEIKDAINHVINKNDINEIAEYITNNQQKRINSVRCTKLFCPLLYTQKQ